jgi:hypothetical protein
MSPLDLIPAPYRLIVAGLAVAAAVGALLAWGAHRESTGHAAGMAAVQAKWDAERAIELAAAHSASEAARAEEARRVAAMKEIDDAHEKALAAARGDALLAGTDAAKLRQRIATLIAAARGSAARDDSPASHVGPPAEDPGTMLADVLGRCVQRVQFLATVADERGAAGAACERAYDSLTPEK